MPPRTKQTAALVLVAVLVVFVLLSVSLSDLHLQAGAPFPGGASEAHVAQDQAAVPASVSAALPVLEVILGIALVVLVTYVPVRLVRLVSLRRFLLVGLGIILLIVILNILPRVLSGPPSLAAGETSVPTAPRSTSSQVTPLGEPPPAFLWIAAGCLFVGAGVFAARLLARPQQVTDTTTALAQTAEDALGELAAGKAFSSVIIRCYLQMSEVLRTERKIERPFHATAREFQVQLEQEGLPSDSVQLLTQLFEKARYGAEQMSQLDEDAGRACLQQIVQSVRARNTEANEPLR